MNNTIIAADIGGCYRMYLAITTELVQTAADIHGTSNVATAALGRTITAAGLMGLMLQDERSTLTLQIKGDGPASELLASADASGRVRGYIADPDIELPLKGPGKLDVGGAVGKGTLTVIKDLKLKEPYIGRIDLVSGEIAEDLTQYFMRSEQQPTAVALGVRIGTDGRVENAGGLILQLLPDATDVCVDRLERCIATLDNLTDHIGLVNTPTELLEHLLVSMPPIHRPRVLEERNIEWYCGCSAERMEQALMSIGKHDLKQLIEEDGSAEIICHFCLEEYMFECEKLEELLAEVERG